jgi:hypothetical protein
MSPDLQAPWKSFLEELDSSLGEPLGLHCIGGFAAVAAYGLPRSTNDLDYFTLVPFSRVPDLEAIAGEGSPLARKHRVHVHHAGVASLPEGYEERMHELFSGHFKRLRLFVLDPYDMVLSKLTRNEQRDREDVAFLAESLNLDAEVLRERYDREMRVVLIGPIEKHNSTLEFWLEAYFKNTS